MKLTARQLNRATLARQLLLRREPLGVVDAVHRVVALQAQEAPSPYLALWNRIADFDPADLDAALASQALVKATLIRITLHVVDAAEAGDLPPPRQLVGRDAVRRHPRAFRLERPPSGLAHRGPRYLGHVR